MVRGAGPWDQMNWEEPVGMPPDQRDFVPPAYGLADTIEDLVGRPWFMFAAGIVALGAAMVGIGSWSCHVYPGRSHTVSYETWMKEEYRAPRDARHEADRAEAVAPFPISVAMTFGGGVAGVLLVGRACFRIVEGK